MEKISKNERTVFYADLPGFCICCFKLVTPSITQAKHFFTDAGFSVWLVRRETAAVNTFQSDENRLFREHELALKRIQQAQQALAEEKKRIEQLSQDRWVRLGRFLKVLRWDRFFGS